MLQVTAGSDLRQLSDVLGGVMVDPLPDPMAAETIVIPSLGTQRWLSLEIARRCGASSSERADGVAGNIDYLFPNGLVRRVLGADEADPWELSRVVWSLLTILDRGTDERVGPLGPLPPGATAWGRARHLADLFDRYHTHRPEMIRAWAAGHDLDGAGTRLDPTHEWQPQLWRRLRDHIGTPSPPERLPAQLAALAAGEVDVDLPSRVFLFGLTTIPGGSPFMELLDAVAAHRDVHLLLHQPSAGLTVATQRVMGEQPGPVTRRADDPTAEVATHPLLRSWARPTREAIALLGHRRIDVAEPAQPGPATLLGRLQSDIAADRSPGADHVVAPDDRSIRFHSCQGPTRQVEVLRDQLLHLLADDPTLTEDDIVVFCPRLDAFAPHIERVFGPSVDGTDPNPTGGAPALRYRVTDRSLQGTDPVFRAVGALIELVASRFSVPAVLEFIGLSPVRQRFGFDDDDVETIADWADATTTRWGLDGDHRQRWGIPADHVAGTWASAVDRLLIGVTATDDPDALVGDSVVPVDVEGSDIGTAGRFAQLVQRLAALADEATTARPIESWVGVLTTAADDLFEVDPDSSWQLERLNRLLTELATRSRADDARHEVDLTIDDIRHVVGEQLSSSGGRADFFRGGLTVSTLTSLRGIPHRVVCLLGIDDDAPPPGVGRRR